MWRAGWSGGVAFLAMKLGVGRYSWEGLHEKAQQYMDATLRDMGLGVAETVDTL
jgi:hypothetical protein